MSDHPAPDPPKADVPDARVKQLSVAWVRILERHRWLPFVLPFVVYLVTGLFEPSIPATTDSGAETSATHRAPDEVVQRRAEAAQPRQPSCPYPMLYVARIGVTLAAIVIVLPGYRGIPFRIGWPALLFGVVGGFLWILTCRLGLEDRILVATGLADWTRFGGRPAFNPLEAFAGSTPTLLAFLAVRFVGLVAVVPLIEEFFLRGFLMRFVIQADWWTVALGKVTVASAAVVAVYAVLSHPSEPIAAVLWFSLITLLLARTRNIWDCVVAHAITNGMLGIYVLAWKDWTLW